MWFGFIITRFVAILKKNVANTRFSVGYNICRGSSKFIIILYSGEGVLEGQVSGDLFVLRNM